MKKYTYIFIFFIFCKAFAIADLSDSTALPTSMHTAFNTWQQQFNCAASQSLLSFDLCVCAYVDFMSNDQSIANLQQWYDASSDEDKIKAQTAYQTFYTSLINHIKSREVSENLPLIWKDIVNHIHISHSQIEAMFLSSQGTSISFIAGVTTAMISSIYALHIGYKKAKLKYKRAS